MKAIARIVIWKTFITVFFLLLALRVVDGPVGHLEPIGSGIGAPLFILFSGIVVLSGKMKRLHVHLAWASVCISAFLPTYRLYRYYRMNDEIRRDADVREAVEFERKLEMKKEPLSERSDSP